MISDLHEFAESTNDSTDLLDRETWGDYSFSRAEELIWNTIAPRAAHQQHLENLVQTAGHLGKTHVEEARQSAKAKIYCIFFCDFNTWACICFGREMNCNYWKQFALNRKHDN
jgi:hypothetical protein